jgi:hypothetical protein
MVPRENLEESVVRTGRNFPAGGIPVFRRDLPVSRLLNSAKLELPFQNMLILLRECSKPGDSPRKRRKHGF